LVLASGLALAQQEDDTVEAVMNDYQAAMRAGVKKQQAKPPPAPMPYVTEDELIGFVDRCWAIFDRSEGEAGELDSLKAVLNLTTAGGAKLEQHWRDAADKLVPAFLDDDRIAEYALGIRAPRKLSAEATALSARIRKESKSPAVAAASAYAELQDEIQLYESDQLDDAGLAKLKKELQGLAEKHGKLEVPFRGATYAEFAKNTIYAIDNLKIGGVAPEIAANDLDGVPFKLSDYRGKVVLLDFWGYW